MTCGAVCGRRYLEVHLADANQSAHAAYRELLRQLHEAEKLKEANGAWGAAGIDTGGRDV